MGSVSVIAIGVVAAAAWAEGPIPLKAPTGYRDYCDGLPKSKRSLCPPGRAPQGLWRKLALPTVSAGGTCPVSAMRAIPGIQAPALGTGPVYFPAGAYNPADRTTMRIVYPASSGPARGSGWGIAKAQLLVKKTFRQPLVVRGRRIDGASELVGSLPARHRAGRMEGIRPARLGDNPGLLCASG